MAVITKAPDKRYTPKSGQVLDARFYTEEILEFRGTGSGNDFGNDTNDRTAWIDLAGADMFHCEIIPGAFRGNVRFYWSNDPNEPGANSNTIGSDGRHSFTDSTSVMRFRTRFSSPDDTAQYWGKWVNLTITTRSTNPSVSNPLIIRFYIRRLESRRD